MGTWDTVQTDFEGDETTNFGPRKEAGTALYQVDTLATISPRDEVACEVSALVTAACGELACVGVDQHLSVFRDSQHQSTIAFEHIIEDCALSPDGSLLVVVDASGKLYIFNAETLQSIFCYKLITNSRQAQGERVFQKIDFYGKKQETTDFTVLTASGMMFVVKNLSPAEITQDCDNIASILQQQLKFAVVQTSEVHTQKTLDVCSLGQGGVITAGQGDNVLAVWEWRDSGPVLKDAVCSLTDSGAGIVFAKLASSNKVLFTLDENNEIGMWSVPALVLLQQFSCRLSEVPTHVSDVLLLETLGTQPHSVDGTRLVMLETSDGEDNQNSTTVRILSLPQSECVYTLHLGHPACLPKCPVTQESLYLAEGSPDSADPDKISTVLFRCLTETTPETRLQSILRKKRFDEALNFADIFELDKEPVYAAHMNHLLDQLSPRNVICYNEENVSSMVTQLWLCLNNVKDSLLAEAENCVHAALPSFGDTWKLLKLCQNKLETVKTERTDRLYTLQTKLLELQNRLTTFKLMYGTENYSAESWMRFQQANLLHMACHHMMEHQPHIAILLWRRHVPEWTGQLTSQVMGQLLKAVPDQLVGSSMLDWLLSDVIPYVARLLPESLGRVLQWAVQRAESMEFAEKDGWPKNALDFLHAVHKQVSEVTEVDFTNTKDTAAETASKTLIEVDAMLEPLCSTLRTLQQLYDLQQYNLRLPLGQFQKETRETLAFRMLDRVVMVELIQPTLKQYIAPYLRANNLDQDHIFATYIKDLLERVGHVRSYTGGSPWEDKVVAIVSFIQQPKEKCCAVLNVMKYAPLPWSPGIQQVVEEALKIQHPMVKELQEQKKIAGIRQLLLQYDLKIMDVPSQRQAQKVAKVIINKDSETSLQDALRILKEYNLTEKTAVADIYVSHACLLITSDRVTEYMEMLRGLAPAAAKQYGLQIVSLAEIYLEEKPPDALKEIKELQQQQMTEAAVLTLRYLTTLTKDVMELSELNTQLALFSSLASLQREYGLYLSVKEYMSDESRSEAFARLTQQLLRERNILQEGGGLTRLYRLADLLLLRREEVQMELAVREAKAGNMDAAVFLCKELLKAEPSHEAGQALWQAGKALLCLQNDDQSMDEDGLSQTEYQRLLPHLVEKLASRAVIMCDAELLPHCLELSKAARLWKNVSAHCEASDSPQAFELEMCGQASKPKCRSPLQNYTLSPVYRDDALVMSSSIALPLANRSLTATMAVAEGDDGAENEEEDVGVSATGALNDLRPVIIHLRENSHLQLALRFLIHTYTVVRQTLLQQGLGLPVCDKVQTWLEKERAAVDSSETKAAQVMRDLVTGILAKMFSAQSVDQRMALWYLQSVPRKVSFECVKKITASCGLNFRKLEALAGVGVALGHLLKEASLTARCQELETSARWGVRLGKLKISFKEAFQGGISTKRDIIAALARCEHADISLVRDFCIDFKVDPEDGFLIYLEHVLTRLPGTDFVNSPSDPSRLARAQATVAAVKALDREKVLLDRLDLLWKQTSPYDYETIEFLLGEVNKLDPRPLHQKGLKLVSYLKVYNRHNPPSEFEVARVTQEQKDEAAVDVGDTNDTLPLGAMQRMPVHLLLEGNPWKVITSELDAETVPTWLHIARLLELSTDEVYLMAVQNIVRQHVAHARSSNATQTRDKNSAPVYNWTCSESSLKLLEDVQRLLSSVQKCEMALACANWVVKELPVGGEKVLALQGCVAFARRWHEVSEENTSQKEKSRAAYLKFEKVLRKLLTEQALHQFHLAEPQYLQLVSNPTELISQLTEHPATLGSCDTAGQTPDIYGAVTELAAVNELDVGHVLVMAIRKCLLSDDLPQDGDTTMNFSFSGVKFSEEPQESEQQDSIRRGLYFLRRGPRQQMLEFLIGETLMGEEEWAHHLGRMSCLYCLLQIANDNDLHPLGHTRSSIRELLRVLCYLHQLEQLHILHSVKTFRDCNKSGLVKGIWRNHSHQRVAVGLAASLCLDYKLDDRHQWGKILQQMISLNMVSELEFVLQRLSSVPALWNLPVFSKAWQVVITSPLTKATLPLNDEQRKMCVHSLNLAQSCPVPGRLDFKTLSEHFRGLGLDICAAACLSVDPEADENKMAELLSGRRAELLTKVYELTRLGLNLASATQVRECLFQMIVEEGDYENVVEPAQRDFVNFVIALNNIDGCLMFAVNNNLLSQAEQVLQLYLYHHPEVREEISAWCEDSGNTSLTALQTYLHLKELI